MSNTFFTVSGNFSSNVVASATGHDGFAHGLIYGGTATGAEISAIATSATTQAVINLEDTVNGGSVTAKGNAQIYIDSATISGGTLQTTGVGAEIGVFGGGSATVIGTTVSKGSNIFDDGSLTFSGGAAQADVTFLAHGTQAVGPGTALTLSATMLGAGDHLLAEEGGLLNVSAASAGTTTFSAGTIVGATANGEVDIYGGVANSGTIEALALGGVDVNAHVNVYGGTAGTFTNAKGGLVEAEAISGYNGSADVYISAGGAVANSGTMVASATTGYENNAKLVVEGGTFTNAKGATITQASTLDTGGTAYVNGSAGVTNLGTIKGTASKDSYGDVTVETYGGPIVNSGTISVAATTSGHEDLYIDDNTTSGGSLTNAKGAAITVSATAASTAYFNVEINQSGTVSNSGTMLFAANNDSEVGGYSSYEGSLEGGAIVNAGTINAVATNNSYAENRHFDITGSAGGLTNSGKIDAIASNSSSATQEGYFAGTGSLINTGTMQAVATSNSTANEGWDMNDEGSLYGGNLSNAKTMGASATTNSYAEFYVDYYANGFNSGTIAATAADRSQADVYLNNGGTFTNTKTVTASETGSSYAETEVHVVGSGGSGAVINNTSAMTAVGNIFGEADLSLYAESTSALIDNTGTITATAIAGATAYADVYVDGTSASIDNSKLMGAITNGGKKATLYVTAEGTSNTIINTGTIEAVANGGTAYVQIGGDNYTGAVVNNTGGTLLATETAGTAFLDLSEYYANVSGGTLKTVGPNAYLGAIYGNTGSATNVTIAARSQIVGWSADLYLADIVGSISAGTLVQAAKSGDVYFTSGNVSNSGTIEALASYNAGDGYVNMEDGTGSGSIANSATIKASVTSGYYSDYAQVYMSAGTVTNAKNGVIEALATNESYYGSENYVEVFGSSVVNSGTILASASNSSNDYVEIIGGTVTNAATGKIEAIATNQSSADAYIVGSTTNAGLIEASGGADSTAAVYLSGAINNSGGTILATGNGAIYLGEGFGDYQATVTSGTLKTVGSEAAAIVTGSSDATLSAVTIASGSLVLSEDHGTLTLENGTIIGNNKKGTAAASVVAYSRTGDITVSGTVTNSGILAAGGAPGGGIVDVTSGATVSGNAVQIDEFGTVDVLSGGSANVAFGLATSGILEIADTLTTSAAYGGIVAGFGGVGGEFPGQLIDLGNVAYVSGAFSASVNSSTDVLTVTSGGTGVVASIQLSGNYTGATFNIVDDTSNNTVAVSDPSGFGTTTLAGNTPTTLASTAAPPPSLINYTGASNVALLGSYMASMFASPEGSIGSLTTQTAQNHAVLAAAHPHA